MVGYSNTLNKVPQVSQIYRLSQLLSSASLNSPSYIQPLTSLILMVIVLYLVVSTEWLFHLPIREVLFFLLKLLAVNMWQLCSYNCLYNFDIGSMCFLYCFPNTWLYMCHRFFFQFLYQASSIYLSHLTTRNMSQRGQVNISSL